MSSVTIVPVELLKPHPKSGEIPPLDDKIRAELEEDIRQNGIVTPLILARDCTILAGHQRWEIAKELGLPHVPAIVRQDIDPDAPEAVALLIKDNLLRRHLNDVQVAKLIRLLKEEYGVRRGGYREPKLEDSRGSNCENRSLTARIAGEVGLSERTVWELDKLNELIPELQGLVARGVLSRTAAYSLAFLAPGEQRDLLRILGESGVCGLSVQEAQELRRQLGAERKRAADVEARLRDLERQLIQAREGSREAESLRAELARLKEENERLKARGPEVVEKVVERVVVRPDPAQEAEIARLREEVERLQARLAEAEGTRRTGELQAVERELEEKRRRLEEVQAQLRVVDDWLKARRATQGLLMMLRKLFTPLERAREEVGERFRTTEFAPLHRLEIQEWIALLEWYLRRLRDLLNVRTGEVIDICCEEARTDG
jgi:ParB family chromosome partitioning protein